jgi:hypothetical protein
MALTTSLSLLLLVVVLTVHHVEASYETYTQTFAHFKQMHTWKKTTNQALTSLEATVAYLRTQTEVRGR